MEGGGWLTKPDGVYVARSFQEGGRVATQTERLKETERETESERGREGNTVFADSTAV